jgi:hypothetical protein
VGFVEEGFWGRKRLAGPRRVVVLVLGASSEHLQRRSAAGFAVEGHPPKVPRFLVTTFTARYRLSPHTASWSLQVVVVDWLTAAAT